MIDFHLAKNPFGLFRQFFAVCCAHNLFALGEQIPHLQLIRRFGGELCVAILRIRYFF